MDQNPRVLLVEDEPLIRASLADSLEEAGYVVLESGTGEDAIAEFGDVDIAAVVTDIRLGAGISGWEVARVARQKFPSLAVVYMTGDSAADWAPEGVPSSIIVQKPFANVQVITAVSNLLNAGNLFPVRT